MTKAIVLLSGGQDSTTSLFWAKMQFDKVEAISFDYGQRHVAELNAALQICQIANVPQRVMALGDELGNNSALTNTGIELKASGGHADSEMPEGLPTSFVPGRNHLFLSLAAIYAAQKGIKDIVTGVCQTDFSGYPDCRRQFVDALENALTLAMPTSLGPIRIHTPLMYMTKAETVHLAHRLSINTGCWNALRFTITCYEGKRPGCGECPACALRARGFKEAGHVDPAE